MTVIQMIEHVSALIEAVSSQTRMPCDHKKDQQASCVFIEIEHYSLPIPSQRVQRLCPSCRAYYLLQMARNALVEYARTR